MSTSFYDAIVLGDDLAGLVCAALCARRGLRVLVSQNPQSSSERYALGPYTFSRTPFPLFLESSPAVRRVVSELNFVQSLKRRLIEPKPAFQVLLPDARIDVTADLDQLGRELERELPQQRDALLAFAERASEVSKVLDPVLGQDISIPPVGFWEKRELKYSQAKLPAPEADLLPGVPPGHPARAFIALPAALTLGVDPRTLSATAIARAFDLWRRSSALLEGGRDTLRQMLLEKLRTKHSGEVQTLRPEHIDTRWGKVQGLKLRDRGETVGANVFVCASSVAEFGDFFGDKWPKRVMQLAKAVRPTAYRYVLHIVVAEAGVPEGLGRVAFCVTDPERPLMGDNAFALYRSEPDDQARVTLTVVANAPAPGDHQTLDDVFVGLRRRLMERLDDVLPFASEHILLSHSPNQGRPPEGMEIKEAPPIFAADPLWSSTLESILGVGATPYDIGLKNVTTASSQNLPGLGPEGDFTAGWCAAKLACGAAGKKKNYLKDEVLFGGPR